MVVADQVGQTVVEQIDIVDKFVGERTQEVKLYGIHIFRHEVLTTTIGVLGVLPVEIGRIYKRTGIGRLDIERLRGKID